MIKSKLTTEQWESVAEWILSGYTLIKAQERILKDWDITVSQVTIWRQKAVRAAIQLRDKGRIYEAREIGGNAVPTLMRSITNIITDLSGQRLELREEQAKFKVGSKEYSQILAQIKTVDQSLSNYNKQLMDIMQLTTEQTAEDNLQYEEDAEIKSDMIKDIISELRSKNDEPLGGQPAMTRGKASINQTATSINQPAMTPTKTN